MDDKEKQHEANLQQQFGDCYQFSDHKRGARIQYRSSDGRVKWGTVTWIQEPGQTMKTHQPLPVRYVVEPDEEFADNTMGFEFVFVADIITK